MLKAILGTAAIGLSLYEMWRSSKPVLGNVELDEEDEQFVYPTGAVGGSPGGGGGGGGGHGGGALGPVGGSPRGGGMGPALGPVQGNPSGGHPGMGPSGGQWVPTHPIGGGGRHRGDGIIFNGGWGVSGWGWPYYGYPYYPYPYPQTPQGMVCTQSEDDPKQFVCYPQYNQQRAYAWGPPGWGWSF